MSLAHFISLQNKDPGFDTFVNGKAIAHASDALERIAEQEQVTSIMSFYGKKWYEADQGLQTVRALMEYLKTNPTAVEDADEVIEDLKEWEDVLLKAKTAGIKWKMKIDY
ncbi:hypothetical protein [Undibacterium fentianense]|uniref:Uncharacterized protein n=1 Tax=Undibacterium fentianense TaxID=2828728 RepID=A0A941E2B8_9BURK|nr:hypothetical protein [Undibacterium fentianense]MBR7800121.1 hypothetical protein [Undibacterium fentianense]